MVMHKNWVGLKWFDYGTANSRVECLEQPGVRRPSLSLWLPQPHVSPGTPPSGLGPPGVPGMSFPPTLAFANSIKTTVLQEPDIGRGTSARWSGSRESVTSPDG
jgi:hypothetical protein